MNSPGGGSEVFDTVGVNYYWNNQWSCEGQWLSAGRWLCEGEPLSPFDPRTRPLHALLAAVHARYGRPLLLAETSIEGDLRAPWLRHVGGEVQEAMRACKTVGAWFRFGSIPSSRGSRGRCRNWYGG